MASKSSSAARRDAALTIMDAMREHSATIVEQVNYLHPWHSYADIRYFLQASIVSHELIRVAILWHELWHEGLEEASRLYFTERNPEGMVAVLEPLHDMIEAVRGPAIPARALTTRFHDRDQPPLVRFPLSRHMVEICTRLGRLVARTLRMAKPRCSIELGISITGFVCSAPEGISTNQVNIHRSSRRSRNSSHS